MDRNKYEEYYRITQSLAQRLEDYPETIEELLTYIDGQMASEEFDRNYMDFFNAEKEFYQGHYDRALKHYLQAKVIHDFQFFCFRASALVAKSRGNHEQALKFARKALRIHADDVFAKNILQEEGVQAASPYHVQQNMHAEAQEGDQAYRFAEANETGDIHEMAQLFEDKEIHEGTYAAEPEASDYFQNVERLEEGQLQGVVSSSLAFAANSSTESLTKRLYPISSKPYEKTSEHTEHKYSFQDYAIIEDESVMQDPESSRTTFLPTEDPDNMLEKRIENFQKHRSDAIGKYVQEAHDRPCTMDFCLYTFNGWGDVHTSDIFWLDRESGVQSEMADKPNRNGMFTNSNFSNAFGGFYLRWNGKGIAVNPGKSFLKNFHRQGLFIKDIDYVVVTQNSGNNYADVKEIYELNYQLNKVSAGLHIINYYLNQAAYRDLSHVLKPHFKQERNAIHPLELFLDSPDVEKAELYDGATLNYFPLSSQEINLQNFSEDRTQRNPSNLGIRIDLRQPENPDRKAIKIGYVSGTSWSPLLAHHVSLCDVLFAGFGNTNPNDYTKLSYNENCLGYFGSLSLLEEIKPKILLLCEFDGREGDIRLEVAKKMRYDISKSDRTSGQSAILPVDSELLMDLRNFKIRCVVSQAWIEPGQIKVVRSANTLGNLLYLSPLCLL